MKKKILAVIILMFFANETLAQVEGGDDYKRGTSVAKFKQPIVQSQLVSQPYISIEYSAPRFSHNNKPNDFRTNVFEKQIADFENIALGLHLRLHKFFGLNANWQQSELNSGFLKHVSLSQKARFNIDHYNFSGLFYFPVTEKTFDIFVELGASDMSSKLNYTDSNQNFIQKKSHKTAMIYGAGFQINPFENSKDMLRFSFQKYTGDLLTNTEYTTIRAGYLKAF